jgi:hypothetical protein
MNKNSLREIRESLLISSAEFTRKAVMSPSTITRIETRPKSKIRRETISTAIDKKLIELVRDLSVEIGIPINRLIENALRATYEKKDKK